jgi:gluconolactonase
MTQPPQTPGWPQSLRYPDPLITHLDPRFRKYHLPLSSVDRLYQGTRWGEGPVWFGDLRSLIWSDVPGNRMLKWDEETEPIGRLDLVHRSTLRHLEPL